MGLEVTFRQLTIALHKFHDALSALHVTVGDKPPNDDTALADGLENTVMDIMGTLHEIRKSAGQAQKAVSYPIDLESARHALTVCHESFHSIEQQFASELVSYEKLKALARLGSERRAWHPWASSIKQGIEQCRAPLESTSTSLAACWQELAERLGSVNISMKALNVGQQITVSKPKIEDLEIEGVT
jgi:hypothetical protein